MRPVIGITTYVEPASWAVWHDLPTVLVPHDYVAAVTAAGGRAVLLPPDDLDADVLRVLDGLVLSGGADIDPGLYGADPGPLTVTRPDRDAAELLLARAALALDLPVLGICRGMQLLVAAAGGALHQHLPDVLGHDRHRPAPAVYGRQEVLFTAGSRVAALMGDDREVRCYHHQGVADPGSLLVTGRTEDGSVEAVEDPARSFVVGVQWHPEVMRDKRLFGALVAAASRRG
ncbi:gamma-glutamyl-gamma-aminobutyrate hydrolase family protein [Couchioplanes azureus]|uniref:gamma-glutamyl-gamma-aminobutyrate hydrolase family protein n=1 Tax=Couchioplanes caeruleus TaxID=56438 RepID=UPI0016712A25|nr:gamma-glutamyl-gamma-aminobutyrate hydrolase family protein [Couchioplanes caeruleus]GGQ57833.1 gamma-glutamyl-gamma-aminobutyrate hydrolase [Couchioplanes caeruleus subsp. azureus]